MRPGSHATTLPLTLAAALALGACGDPPPPPPAKPIGHVFRLVGPAEDRPFREGLFLRYETPSGWGEWNVYGWSNEGDFPGMFKVEAPPGVRYEYTSEKEPSPAMAGLFWALEGSGTFPDEERTTDLKMQPRARIRLLPGDAPYGVDVVTVVAESTDLRGWAINDPGEALFEGYAHGRDRGDADAFKRVALQRPFTCDTFKPGKYVVAGRVKGRQWTARRVDLRPGETFELDCGAQPPGGGTVVCENGHAVLLLNADLPIPMPYRRTDVRYRTRWEHVPPGQHAVRYPDGTKRACVVEEGQTVTLPKRSK